jgi:acetyl esterase
VPLDPQVQILLDQMAAMGGPSLHEVTPEEARQMIRGLAMISGEGPPVADVTDRSAGSVAVRVYRPQGDDLPILVWYHGGGWVIGDLETADASCRELAVRVGCVVVSVDYRLAPEHPFPAGVDDAWEALRWTADHARELGGDPARLAVGGDSAGGNIAAVVAHLARDRGGPPIAFQLLVYPVTDLRLGHPSMEENAEGYVLTRDSMVWFRGHYVGANEADVMNPLASPLLAEDHAGLPPALIVTAEYDPLRDEGEAYGRKLEEAGVPVTVHRFDGQIHGFVGMVALLDDAKVALEEAAEALRGALSR